MKKTLFFLLLLFVSFSSQYYAFADDDNDEGDVIDITYIEPNQSHNRSQLDVPIHASYYALQNVVIVSFDENIGNVDACLTNLYTGNNTMLELDSAEGGIIIPIVYGSGAYSIRFLTCEGVSYIGYFVVF